MVYGNSYLNDYYYPENDHIFSEWTAFPAAIQGVLVGLMVMLGIVALTALILQIIGMWKTFEKANQKGWASIIPLYNLFTVVKIVGLELWAFVILAVVPLMLSSQSTISVNSTLTSSGSILTTSSTNWALSLVCLALVFALNYKVAKSFGKTTAFAIGLTLLPPVFWMILGSSPSIKYLGPDGPYKIKYPSAPKK